MARLLKACDALSQAKDVNAGFSALASLLGAVNEVDAPPMKEVAEILSSMQLQMRDHLDNLGRCLDD